MKVNKNTAENLVDEFNSCTCEELEALKNEISGLNQNKFRSEKSKECWICFLDCLAQEKGCDNDKLEHKHNPPFGEEALKIRKPRP